jgi:hypothetical protein
MVFSIDASKPANDMIPGVPTGSDSDMVSKKKSQQYSAKTVLNGIAGTQKSPKKISTIPAEDGSNQTSITQTSRREIIQGQFEGLYTIPGR